MRKLYITTILLFLFNSVGAQDAKEQSVNEEKLWFGLDFGLDTKRFNENKENEQESVSIENFTHLWGVRLKAGYYLTPRISLGFGAGLNTKNRGSLPIFLDFRYLPAKKWYAYANVGGAVGGHEYERKSGFMSELGLGSRLRIWKRFAFNPSLGYNLLSYRFKENTFWKHTFAIRLGFEI
ncbi:MAG: porin family protein [Prevotellaceae bacterium]|jgi:hypothetical protein|nr:porin family protein [Prevotellaceae bacterium]